MILTIDHLIQELQKIGNQTAEVYLYHWSSERFYISEIVEDEGMIEVHLRTDDDDYRTHLAEKDD